MAAGAKTSEGGVRDATHETSKSGAFVRTDSTCREWVGTEAHPVEPGRYHLYVSYACPWANRCLAALAIKQIPRDVIGVTVSHPVWDETNPGGDKHRGWQLSKSEEFEDTEDDPLFGAKSIREVYEKLDAGVSKFTVPMLVDKVAKKVVNNESSEILRMFNSSFNEFAGRPDIDLYPEDLRASIDEINEWIYHDVNNGVYKSGFARSQEAYDDAVTKLYAALDRAEDILSKQRYLTGDRYTEADLRFAMTLFRFDEVYTIYFKCSKAHIRDYKHLSHYIRDMYQVPGVASTVNMKHIKHHYYRSHPVFNSFGIVPHDSDLWPLDGPHNRDEIGRPDPALHTSP